MKSRTLHPQMTVRQVVGTWPASAALFEPLPLAKVDGRWTLQELGPFARDSGLGESEFLDKLATVAGVPIASDPPAARDRSPMRLLFIAIAIGLTLGAGWGVGLLLQIAIGADYGLVAPAGVHVHGVAQFWGWVALFVLAIGSHLLRQNTTRPAAPWLDDLAAGFIVTALGLLFLSLSSAVRDFVPWIAVAGSALLALAAACFAASVVWSLLGRSQSPLLWHRFVIATIGWLGVWAAADLYFRLTQAHQPVLSDSARAILIAIPVLGFATNAIYGFGIRLIPGLLNIVRQRPAHLTAALVLHNLGLILFLISRAPLPAIGAAMMLVAAIAYLSELNFLRSAPSREIYGVDPRGHILIRAAFGWLVIGLAMVLFEQICSNLPHPYSGAWRHALTVGFITTMILGVAHRMAPIFIKQPLASSRLMLTSAGLILIGNALRVGLELATISGATWTFRLMGLSGVLELTAIFLFGVNLALTVRNRRRIYAGDTPLTADTRVREAINVFPNLQQRLDALGIDMLNQAPFVAPSMTFGALALASGWRPADLLQRLTSEDTP